MLNIRKLNEGIDNKREELFDEYKAMRKSDFQLQSMSDYEELKKVVDSRKKTRSRYVRDTLMENVRGRSNGENAYKYFIDRIGENGLFILDEPENSLSPKLQMELVKFIEDSARFFECQIVLSTHSPFMLAINGAKIYDLDDPPVRTKNWTELENVRLYHEFFKSRESEF